MQKCGRCDLYYARGLGIYIYNLFSCTIVFLGLFKRLLDHPVKDVKWNSKM